MNETRKQGCIRTETVPQFREFGSGATWVDFPMTQDSAQAGPTQAQIEAAAIAICKSATCEGINCCQWPANGGKRRDSRGQAVQCNVKIGAYDDAATAALTAAAEAGVNEVPAIAYAAYDGPQDMIRAAVSTTIERCAQVADDYLGIDQPEVGRLIRAMKEKP